MFTLLTVTVNMNMYMLWSIKPHSNLFYVADQ